MPLLDFLFRPKKKEKDFFDEFYEQIKSQVEAKSFLKEEHQPLPDIFEARQLEEPVVRLDAMMGGRDVIEEPVTVPDWIQNPEEIVRVPDWFGGRQEPEEVVAVPDWFGGRDTIDDNYLGLKALFEGEVQEPVSVPEWFGEREVVTPHLQSVVRVPDFIREELPQPLRPDVTPPMPQPDRLDMLIQPWIKSLEKTILQHKTYSIAHMFSGRDFSDVGIPDFLKKQLELEEIKTKNKSLESD